ncbi:MAG: ribosome silencing factor [Acidobacteriota bacterium]
MEDTAIPAVLDVDARIFEDVKSAAQAADDKKAKELLVLRVAEITSFTDYFVICSGSSVRQVQAIADAVTEQLKARGMRPMHTEGYSNGEWVLIDYGTFVVHVFTETSRRFYDLERLWRDAERVEV